MMRIAIGCDHVAIDLKNELIVYLESLGYQVIDVGTNTSKQTDYPIYAKEVCAKINNRAVDCGILICGTGIGMSICANKVKNIRAVACSEPYSAKLSKAHNNTNVLALGARVIGVELAKMITFEWLNASFEAGRHSKRISMYE